LTHDETLLLPGRPILDGLDRLSNQSHCHEPLDGRIPRKAVVIFEASDKRADATRYLREGLSAVLTNPPVLVTHRIPETFDGSCVHLPPQGCGGLSSHLPLGVAQGPAQSRNTSKRPNRPKGGGRPDPQLGVCRLERRKHGRFGPNVADDSQHPGDQRRVGSG
jgi:hypothetical protein